METGAAARDAGAAAAEGGAGGAGAGFGGAMAKMAKVGAIGLVGLGLAAVKMSNTFQTEMLKIRTEGGATAKEFTRMRAAVLNLAATGQSFGQGPVSLAQGLYHLESMGIRGSKAILGLKLASAEAAISGASLEDTTTSLGGALFIAAKGTHGLTGVMGALNAIAGAGNMRFQDLNEALGTGLLGAAKTAGVSLQEMGAALAVLTDSGYKASSAGAQLGTALHYLYAPTTKAQTALESIGLSGGKLASDLRKPQGILVALRDLKSHMEALRMSPNDQAQFLNTLLPGGRGRVLLNLYQLQNRLAPKYGQIRGTENDFGAHMMQQALNPATRMHVAIAKLQAEMIMLGDALTKYVTPAFTLLVGVLAKLIGWLLDAVNWFVKMNPAAKALATFIGILAGAFLAYRAALLVATVAQGLFNLVMAANPIAIVVIAIAALVAAIVYAYNKFKWFRDFVNGIPGALSAAWKGLKGFFSGLWADIKGIFTGGVNGLIAAINWVIGAIDSIHVSIPSWVPVIGGDKFGFNIGKISPIGAPGHAAVRSQAAGQSSGNPRLSNIPMHTAAFTKPATGHHGAHHGPLIVHGDIVVRARENELGRITRRQLHAAMAA